MIPGSANPLLLKSAAAAGAYQIQRSLRFNSSDSGFCSRTPGTASNRKTWTWAAWVKRTVKNTATDQMLFTGGTTNSDTGFLALDFNSSDKLRLSSAVTNFLVTTAVYRDPGAWMHIVLAFDATQGTNANKVKLYVNSTEVTVFDTDGRSSISNQDYGVNQAAAHEIGRASLGSNKYLDGYLADIHFIDGQALTPSSFTEVSATTGQLIPKAYSGTYGTNGFQLKFADNSAATATTLGKDTSGNSNNWTPNNLSVTAGAGNDSLVDTPTSYGTPDTGVGGEVRGNYCTWNILKQGAAITSVSNGNLDWLSTTVGSNYTSMILGTIGVSSGKWYWENTVGSLLNVGIGIATDQANLNTYPGGDAYSWSYLYNAVTYNNGSFLSYGASYTTGDIIGVALNLDTGTLTFYKNGVSQGVAYSGLSGPTYFPMSGDPNSSTNGSLTVNFGQRAFAYTAPSGFKALCDTNLGAPLVAKGNTVMDVALYTGNGSTQTISGLNFSPDLVWIKARSAATAHLLFDQIRGATYYLSSNATDAESNSPSTTLTAFTSDGFTLGSNSSANGSSVTLAAWAWDAGTSTVSNTQGSITSQVRANASAGFSVVTYTGNGSAGATIGHGLGVAPAFLIIKGRGHVSSWHCYHSAIGNTSAIFLSSTSASVANSVYWNNTSPGSTTFTVGTSDGMNGNTNTYVAYCFSSVVGYSSAFTFTGNGSSDGPFCFLGFRPKLLLIKRSDSTGNWLLVDSVRGTYNLDGTYLYANTSDAEVTQSSGWDLLSNGFKNRNTYNDSNSSGATYVGFAWAENPFQYARAR